MVNTGRKGYHVGFVKLFRPVGQGRTVAPDVH